MAISLKNKKSITNEDISLMETKIQKAKQLHTKVNQFKWKVKEFKYEKEQGNPDDILKNI